MLRRTRWPVNNRHYDRLVRPGIILLMFMLQVFTVAGQSKQKTFKQDDVWSIFAKEANQAQRDSVTSKPMVLYKPYYSITPFVGYNPAYGMLIGVGSTVGILLGKPATTPVSTVSLAINLTAKSQKILNLRTNIITAGSRFILRGDWRFMIFSQPTYGLGSGRASEKGEMVTVHADGETVTDYGTAQQIDYNYIRFYETFYFRIWKKLYAGVGYALDDYTKIKDLQLNLESSPAQITSHYKYCTDHGFNPEHQTISGFSIEMLLDSRDNSIRPTRGYFANLAFRPNFAFLGSSKNSLMLNTEFRTYLRLSSKRPDHLVAFWYTGQFTQKGRVPYLGLPAIGWDMYNRTGRGYIQGSIRGVSMVYAEAEYRFPLSRYTGILAGVVFINATSASSDDASRPLFSYADPAAGAGLRVMFNRKTLSNLTIDAGIGTRGTLGVYFNQNEAF